MPSILLSLPEIFNAYKRWVIKNPNSLSDYELTAKWISYFIAGKSSYIKCPTQFVVAVICRTNKQFPCCL